MYRLYDGIRVRFGVRKIEFKFWVYYLLVLWFYVVYLFFWVLVIYMKNKIFLKSWCEDLVR